MSVNPLKILFKTYCFYIQNSPVLDRGAKLTISLMTANGGAVGMAHGTTFCIKMCCFWQLLCLNKKLSSRVTAMVQGFKMVDAVQG